MTASFGKGFHVLKDHVLNRLMTQEQRRNTASFGKGFHVLKDHVLNRLMTAVMAEVPLAFSPK